MHKLKTLLCISTAAITMSAFIFTVSCKKSATTAESTATASDQAVAEKSYSDAQTISENAVATPTSMNFRTTKISGMPCATVTSDTSGGNTVVTINFGSTDCTCRDGRTRRGEIIVTYPTGQWFTSGATRTITFSNYFQDDNQITGTKTVTYEGLNSSGQPYFDVTISGTVTYPGGKTISVNWTRTRTWLSGFTISGTTPEWSVNLEYSVSGNGTMTNSAGQSVDVTIAAATPLVYSPTCKWAEAGTISYTLVSDGKTRSVNFGANTAPYTCHDTAVVTLANGTQKTITLP